MLIGSVLPELNVLTHACTEAAVFVLAKGKPVNLTAPLPPLPLLLKFKANERVTVFPILVYQP